MSNADLNSITNENGGGMSYGVTGKYTSVRHERAMRDSEKMTAGEAAQSLRKQGLKITAKELVSTFAELFGWHAIEWHHSGFVPGKGMGKTYFFTVDQIERFQAVLPTLGARREERQARAQAERKRKAETKVQGFSYVWVKEGSRNVKELIVYSGTLLGAPKGFEALEADRFKVAKAMAGRIYRGYDQPRWMDFDPAAWAEEKKAVAKAKRAAKKAEAQRLAELNARMEMEAQERAEKAAKAMEVLNAAGDDPATVFRAWRESGYNDPTGKVTALKHAMGISWSTVREIAKR